MDKTEQSQTQIVSKEFCNIVLSKFGDKLVSLVIFGSRAKGRGRWDSDLDLIIVLEGLPDDWRRKDKILSDLEYEMSIRYGISISPIYFSPQDIEIGVEIKDRLLLGVLLAYEIIYDKNNFFKKNIEKLKKTLQKEGAKYIRREKTWHIPSARIKV